MRSHRLLLGSVGTATLLLLFLALLLASFGGEPAQASNAVVGTPIPPPSTPTPDPQWLALIRSSDGGPMRLQASAPSVNIHLTDRFVAGRVGLASSVTISVTRADTRIAYATATPLPDDGGFFYIAHLIWSGAEYGSGGDCGGGSFRPGDVVWVAQAGTVTTMTVPPLSGLADGSTDVISGTAPPGRPITLYLFPFTNPAITYTRTVTAGGDGRYQALWAPDVDLRPGDSGYIVYAETPHRRAYARFVTPLLRVQVAGTDISGLAAPCSGVEITVHDTEGNTWSEWSSTGTDGRFHIREYWAKDSIPLRPGDRVVAVAAGQTFSTTVLTVTAYTDLGSGKVYGEAPTGAPVAVMRFSGPLSYGWDDPWDQLPAGQTVVTATSSGLYTVSMPLARTDYGAACAFSPDGHQTCARFAVPYLRVRMGTGDGGRCLPGYDTRGQVDAPSAPVTITLRSSRGYLKDVRRLTAAGNGYFQDLLQPDESLSLDGGDTLTVTTPQGVRATLVLPHLTAEAHPLSDTVSGQAPPGTQLVVSILSEEDLPPALPSGALGGGPPPPPYYGYAVRVVTATAEGEYLADFSDEVDITSMTIGEVSMNTPEGHTVVRSFRATTRCRPVLTAVQVNGNYLAVLSDYGCSSLTLRLWSDRGTLKATRLFDFSRSPYFVTYLYESTAYPDGKSRPIPIRPGDRIELQWADQIVTTTVPSLTVALDPSTDVISGQAPPGTTMYLTVYGYGLLTTTVGAQGTYSISLAGEYDLSPGDLVKGAYIHDDTTFFAFGVAPVVRAWLYWDAVAGLLPPLEPYTVGLEMASPSPPTVTGYAGPEGWWFGNLPVTTSPGDTVALTTPDLSLRLSLPFLSARLDRTTATVSGQAPAYARLRVALSTAQYTYRSREVTVTAGGVYTVSFPDLALRTGFQGTLTYFDPDGNEAFLRFADRQWHVTLGQPCIWGQTDMVGAPFTVTLQAGSGPPDDAFGDTSSTGGYFYGCFRRAVHPGDRLTLVQPGMVTTFTVATLTARHEYARQVLEGEAPPASFLEVTLPTLSGSVVRHTRPDASGRYALDTVGLNLQIGRTGRVVMTDKEGNTVEVQFITGHRVHLPLIFK